MPIIDAHLHVVADAPKSLALLDEYDIKMVNVCIARVPREPWRDLGNVFRSLVDRWPHRFGWITSFDMPTFDEPGYAERIISELDADFQAGAAALKLWKNLGMGSLKPDGSPLMVDDPIFEPIFTWMEKVDRPVMLHLADPVIAWRPLVEGAPHAGYFIRNPKWHLYGRTDVPSYEQIIASRDNLVERHPRLRVIGAHLGSMEHDLDAMLKRLRAWPRFTMDTSARLVDLMLFSQQDYEKTRQLFLEFPDRLIFGTDHVSRTPHSTLPDETLDNDLRWLRELYEGWFRFMGTDQEVAIHDQVARGLALPDKVLEQFYEGNARKWMDNL